MRDLLLLGVLAVALHLSCSGQETPISQLALPTTDSVGEQQPSQLPFGQTKLEPADSHATAGSPTAPAVATGIPARGARTRFSYYMAETYLNPSVFTAPAFSASIRMAHPPGTGATRYPDEWRQGAEGFGRNYGDAFAIRISTHTAQFLTGTITREAPWYSPSASHNFFVRSSHALAFTFVDRSDSGGCRPALSNFAGAAAGGFVGNAYLPDGFRDVTHAGQRATFQFGMLVAGNLFREFAPQMPGSVRIFISLIAR